MSAHDQEPTLPHDPAEPALTLEEFTKVCLEFATYHPSYRFADCEVMLVREGRFTARCGITASSEELGTISAGALGRDEFDAVGRASALLEAEVNRRIAERETPPAAPVRVPRRTPRRPRTSVPRPSPAVFATR